MIDGNRMYGLLEALNFQRVSGTEGEERAAEIIRDICLSFGLAADIEPFTTPDGVVDKTQLTVVSPYTKTYEASGFKRSASVDAQAEVVYAENGLEANLIDVEGKIVLINQGIRHDSYGQLLKAKPLCVVVPSGEACDNVADTDIRVGILRAVITDKHEGRLAAMHVRAADMLHMLTNKAAEAQVTIRARDTELTSCNVTAWIAGTQFPEQVIAMTAHYDSLDHSNGMYDNASGSAILMELARYFTANPPARSMRFVWCGSEERGLLGSKAFVAQHADEVEKTRLCINFDLGGTIAGHEFATVTGPDTLAYHIDMMMKEAGFAVDVKTDTYSSDCIPFADSGVPAVSVGRAGAPGMSYIHNRRDVIDYISADALAGTGNIALLLARRMDGAKVFPVERVIPDDMKQKIDKYLNRDRPKEA